MDVQTPSPKRIAQPQSTPSSGYDENAENVDPNPRPETKGDDEDQPMHDVEPLQRVKNILRDSLAHLSAPMDVPDSDPFSSNRAAPVNSVAPLVLPSHVPKQFVETRGLVSAQSEMRGASSHGGDPSQPVLQLPQSVVPPSRVQPSSNPAPSLYSKFYSPTVNRLSVPPLQSYYAHSLLPAPIPISYNVQKALTDLVDRQQQKSKSSAQTARNAKGKKQQQSRLQSPFQIQQPTQPNAPPHPAPFAYYYQGQSVPANQQPLAYYQYLAPPPVPQGQSAPANHQPLAYYQHLAPPPEPAQQQSAFYTSGGQVMLQQGASSQTGASSTSQPRAYTAEELEILRPLSPSVLIALTEPELMKWIDDIVV
ncbi:hypothetical protein MKEN_01453500 [Mycena kentingensis (nom. inval.)]|nr:hypothetical protein MKEN_01453500 [Mycena kentingensis (nom. inval.)]